MLKAESIEFNNKTVINKLDLSDEDFETKRLDADRKLKLNLNKLKKFTSNMELQNDKVFQDTVRNLGYQFMCLQKYNVTLTKKMELRHSLLKVMLDENGHKVIVDILELLLSTLLAAPVNEVPNRSLLNPTQKLMDTLMNYSDLSELFGVKLCQMDKFLRLYHQIQSLLIPPCLKDEITENHTRLLRASISTLYNTLLYDNPDNLVTIRSYKFFDNIKLLLGNKRERLQLSALLFVVYVADESDSTVFKTNHKSITYLLNLLDKAIHSKYQISSGLKTLELARGIEKLSKNDENKQLLVDLGIMPHLKSLLTSEYVKHKEAGLLILWSLAFDDRNRLMINESMGEELDAMDEFIKQRQQDDAGQQSSVLPSVPKEHKKEKVCVSYEEDDDQNDEVSAGALSVGSAGNKKQNSVILNRLREDKPKEMVDQDETYEGGEENDVVDDSIKYSTLKDLLNCNKIMNGLRWTLKDIKKEVPRQKSNDSQHLMISYSWANADRVMSIYDSLVKCGYKVWIDKFNMADTENIMESMAKAVEMSCGVITCISSSYKDSANCRAEAQYAVKIKKTLIPVIVQKKYRPDGWLGFCTVGLQYCDFEGRYTFEQAFSNLLQQIKRIFGHDKKTTDHVDKVDPVVSNPDNSSNSNQSKSKQWSNKEVIDWFKQIGLTKWEWNQEHNGAELVFLSEVARISPNTLFDICRHEIGLSNLRDLRIFYENILKL